MRSRAIKSWYRKAVVAASILVVIVGVVLLVLRQSEGSAEARLLTDGAVPAGVTGALTAEPGSSGLRLCNKTASRVGVAVGYKEEGQWVTEGWWNVGSGSCETLMSGP